MDIQPITIQIAKLRFFISLLVDMKEGDIEPLPNLETKFVCANTLLGLPQVKYKTAKMEKLIELEERLFDNRKKYFSSFSPEVKEKIKETDKQLRQKILKEVQDYQKSKEAELEKLQKELNTLSASKNLVEQEVETLFETKKVLVDLNEEKRKEISQKIEAVKSEIEGVSKQLLDKFKKIASWEFYNSNKSAD